MFTNTSVKKSITVIVALLACAVLLFAACNPVNAFKPVEMPEKGEVESNGGIAVRYGDWIYFVNGYETSAASNNSYNGDIRTGAIVRVKISDLDNIIAIYDLDLTNSGKKEEIKKAVSGWIDEDGTTHAGKVEMVVPNFYYTNNTTTTSLNGIFIFGDRIYITTPNNELDASGAILSSQLVLASYKLDGSDMQRHYVFESNAPQLKLTQIGNDIIATFILDNDLSVLKLGDKQATEIDKNIASPMFAEEAVYYLNEAGSICQFKFGASEAKVLVEKATDSKDKYTIKSVNGDYVYYTVDDGSQVAGLKLYYATSTVKGEVVLKTIPSGSYYGWKNKVVYTASVPEEVVTMYGIWMTSDDGSESTVILDPVHNDKAITFDKLVGDVLYYTVGGKSYTLNLAETGATPTLYAVSFPSSASGTWYTPDIVGKYVFSLGSDSMTVVKFNSETKKNSESALIYLAQPEKAE